MKHGHGLSALMAMVLLFEPVATAGSIVMGLEVVDNFGALEPVVLRALYPGCSQVSGVRYEEGEFRVWLGQTHCGVPPGGQSGEDFDLGRLPAGRYRARLYRQAEPREPIGPPLEFEVRARAPDSEGRTALLDLSGIWWNPSRNGESFLVQHQAAQDRLLIAWNTYDDAGGRDWFVAVSSATDAYGFECALYHPARSGLARVGTLYFSTWTSSGLRSPGFAEVTLVRPATPVQTIHLARYRLRTSLTPPG